MTELLAWASTLFSGGAATGAVLILYRVTTLESDVKGMRNDHKDTRERLIRLEAVSERKRDHA